MRSYKETRNSNSSDFHQTQIQLPGEESDLNTSDEFHHSPNKDSIHLKIFRFLVRYRIFILLTISILYLLFQSNSLENKLINFMNKEEHILLSINQSISDTANITNATNTAIAAKANEKPTVNTNIPVSNYVYVEKVVSVVEDNTKTTPLCRWVFDLYEPSEYEKLWNDNIKEWQDTVCDKLQESEHFSASKSIVGDVIELAAKVDPTLQWGDINAYPAGKLSKSYELMSKFHYKRECYNHSTRTWTKAPGKGVQLIEPLWGFLRDPFDVYCKPLSGKLSGWNGSEGQSKEHIMVQGFAPYAYTLLEDVSVIPEDEWHSHGLPPWISHLQPKIDVNYGPIYQFPKNIMLDLGSSYFKYWNDPAYYTAVSGQWFYDNYHARGVKFDRFIQVEAEELKPREAWSLIPSDLLSRFTLINSPISVDPKNKFDISTLIKSLVQPNDFFVIKVDVDTHEIELPFIESLLQENGVAHLVDELMWEHHVNVSVMNDVWGYGWPGDMTLSYKLFGGLRNKGIRAHSWP